MKIKTLAKFIKENTLDGIEDFEWTEFVFNTDYLDVYNSATEGYTTIELRSGMRQTIAIKFKEFEKLMGEPDKTVIDSKAAYEFSEQ